MLLRFSLVSILVVRCATAVTIHVPGDHPNIQSGIDAAAENDTVLVAPGTYVGQANKDLDFHGSDRVLLSEGGAAFTIIDCVPGWNGGRGFYFHSGETASTVVRGFTITGGTAFDGAGIYCLDSSPTIEDCKISNNSATHMGGGVFCQNADPILSNCHIVDNSALARGGGIYAVDASPTIRNSKISFNRAEEYGGGVYSWGSSSLSAIGSAISHNFAGIYGGGLYFTGPGSVTLEECRVSENLAEQNGGGLFLYDSSASLDRCKIKWNSSEYGGGVFCSGAKAPTFSNCQISENAARNYGGGMYCYKGSALLENSLVASNRAQYGGGLRCYQASPILNHCTFTDNRARAGAGLHGYEASPMVTNSIFWGDSPDEVAFDAQEPGTPTLRYCNIQGGQDGEGNIDADPIFRTFEPYDYILGQNSPCIDSGTGEDDGIQWEQWCDRFPAYCGHYAQAPDMGAYGGPGAVNWLP